MPNPKAPTETKTFTLLDGAFRFYDLEGVLRPSEDAIWVSVCALPHIKAGDTIADIGCGNGVIGILCAKLAEKQGDAPACIHSVDTNPAYTQASALNATLGEVSGDFCPMVQDILKTPLKSGLYNHVITNPPYHATHKGFESTTKQNEHGADEIQIRQWVNTCLEAVAVGGWLTIIHHAGNLSDISDILTGYKHRIIHLKTSEKRPPKRAIIQLQKVPGKGVQQTVHTYNESVRDAVLLRGDASIFKQ